MVTVRASAGESSVSVSEDSRVDLVLHVTPQVDKDRNVNLSYVDVISGTTKDLTIGVLEGRTSQDFSISVGNDNIAAQSTRFFNVLLGSGAGYVVGTPSSVTVSVLDNDVATVSISPVRDTITEGEDAVFKVMLDIATAVPAAVGVEFTGNEESIAAMDLAPIVVTFAAGAISTKITVETISNNNPVMDNLLSATLTYATGSPLLISSTQRSATIMILDDTPVVGVTTLGGGSFIQVLESTGSVTLQLNINPTFNQNSEVNILYSGDVGALTGAFTNSVRSMSTVVMVSANAATHIFVIPVVDDQIAAEFIRRVDVSVAADPDLNYEEASSSVTIAVEDDDVATVSISPAIGTVTESDTITIEVIRDLAAVQASSITLTLTHNGDFFSAVRDTLPFGDNYEGTGINLNLGARHKRAGKVYYHLNHGSEARQSRVTHNMLDDLLNGGENTVDTQDQEPGHDGSDDERSVTIGGYALVLPTVREIQIFRAAAPNLDPDRGSFDGEFLVPVDWLSGVAYWAANFAWYSLMEDDAHNSASFE